MAELGALVRQLTAPAAFRYGDWVSVDGPDGPERGRVDSAADDTGRYGAYKVWLPAPNRCAYVAAALMRPAGAND